METLKEQLNGTVERVVFRNPENGCDPLGLTVILPKEA